jgi:hypothetical protein
MIPTPLVVKTGPLATIRTNGGAHDATVWAAMAANRVISVADTAPPGIREQAHAFREQVREVVKHYVVEATKDRLAHLATELEQAGMREAAALVRSKEV